MKLSIVIPVYNSEKTINEVVSRIDSTVQLIQFVASYEVILINDNSSDNSHNICVSICDNYSNVKYIRFAKNFGQHHALLAGFNYVTGDYIICLDDDLQTPPEEIGKLLNSILEKDLDVVYGVYESKKHSWFRNFGSRVNDIMAYWLLGKPKKLKLSSYFIAKRFIIDEVTKYDNPYPYISGLILRSTSSIGNITISHSERVVGKSNYTLSKLLKLWFNGFTNFSVKPLRLASIIGFLFSIISFILIIYFIIGKIIYPDMLIGWTSIMVIISFFGGVQLLCMGLLGEYIGRIYLSINKTPAYVIKDTKESSNS